MRGVQSSVIFLTLSVLCVGGAFASTSAAEAAAPTATVNPANVMNTLNHTLPSSTPTQQGGLGVQPTTAQQIEAEGAMEATFVLKKVTLIGVMHPLPSNVAALYQAAIGQRMNFNEVQALANQMESTYRDDGYLLMQVILPPQEIDLDKGEVTFQVIEGQIQNVVFTGETPQAARSELKRLAVAVEAEDPITYHTIDRFLVLANQLPGIHVTATLVPNKDVVGGSDLVVNIAQTQASAFINFNNRGTQYIGPTQLAVGASIYDIVGADALSVSGATIPDNTDQLHYGSISYDVMVGPYATEINPSVTTTQTTPGGSLAPFQMYGTSTKLNLNVNQPLYASTPENLTLQTSLYHLNSMNSIFTNQQLYQDQITGLSAGLAYQGVFWSTYNNLNLSATAGLPILGAPNTLSNPSIANGTTQFVKFDANTSQVRYVTDHTSFVLATSAQVTNKTMVSSEQIGYGGQNFGQAFIPYVISGDNGIMGSLEMRYDLPTKGGFTLLQPLIFYDIGTVSLNQPASGSPNGQSGESAGVGFNIQLIDQVQCGLTLAKPLKITHVTNQSMSWDGFFNITAVF